MVSIRLVPYMHILRSCEVHYPAPPEESVEGTMKRFVLVLLIATFSARCAADNTKISPDLQQTKAQHARVVVQYNSQPGLLDLNLLGTLGSILNSLPLVNAVVADLPLGNILQLSNQSNV